MNMRHIKAIIKKQVKDIFKNKSIFAEFIIFPVMAFMMTTFVKMEGMPENYFVNLFATMYVGMAPLTCMAAIIAEEKEKNTLRDLLTSNVKPVEYSFGIGICVTVISYVGACVFGLIGGYTGVEFMKFTGILLAGIIVSGWIGGVIGIASKNQMSATSLTLPVMMVFSFAPMLSMFNDKISRISQCLYSQQISNLLYDIQPEGGAAAVWGVILVNLLIAGIIFWFEYKKKGLVER